MNPVRGEAEVAGYRLRPTFQALVEAEGELGPLFALVERAVAGALSLAETTALLWYCIDGEKPAREAFGDLLCEDGLAKAASALRTVLTQVLAGR